MHRKYGSLLLFTILFSINCYSTTTSGNVQRLIDITDGFVETGNIPGQNSNQGQWETDERFVGFNGIVNWFLSWDDNNLYIGKIGGNNNEGSVIYIRADLPGASFSNSTQAYDGFNPDFSALNGINFVSYLKNGYDEYRNYNGTWSAPNTGLSPSFTNQSDGNHMEMAIPWNSITNGAGKPANIRILFYQIAPNSSSCNAQNPNPFLYAESPWGNGIATNGPNIGVNDGASTSASQPGGCGNGNALITRWWGCFPVIGGVGANGFVATQPDAGFDKNICITQSSVTMQANEPAADAVGTWTLVDSPIGSNPVIVNQNLKNTVINNLNVQGEYVFVWNINYGLCPAVPDTIVVRVWQTPPLANAGVDQLLSCGQTSTNLSGNIIQPQLNYSGGVGSWSAIGSSSINDTTNENSSVTNLVYGSNKFVWMVENLGCPSNSDTVEVLTYAPVTANSVSSQNSCDTVFQLGGNNPSLIQNTASGIWTLISGNNSVIISNPNLFNSNLTGLATGNYIMQWKVSNGNCNSDSATFQLNVYPKIEAGVGSSLQLCNQQNVQLQGIDPTSIHPSVSGVWQIVSGLPVNFSDTANSTTLLTGLSFGSYTIKWKLSNGICDADSALFQIVNYAQPIANAGLDTNICSNTMLLYANSPIQIQSTSQGFWSTASSSSNSTFLNPQLYNTIINNLSDTTLLSWIVSNGACPSDTDFIRIIVVNSVVANAGSQINLCDTNSVTLNAASVINSLGVWSLVSGSSNIIINNPAQSNATVNGLGVGNSVFKWKVTGLCNVDSAEVLVSNFTKPIALAGADTALCSNSLNLFGNNPSILQSTATGLWSVISGAIGYVLNDSSSYNASFSNLSGNYLLQWLVSNGSCLPDTDFIEISTNSQVNAEVGSAISICEGNSITLNAIPVSNAITNWTKVSGSNSIAFSNSSLANTTVSGIGYGNTILRWKVIGQCNIDSTDLLITNYKKPFSDAGADKIICKSSVQLAANNPLSIATTANANWQFVSGPADSELSSNTNNYATLSNLIAGEYIFNWIVKNGICASDTSDIKITVGDGFEIVGLKTINGDNEESNGSISLVSPNNGISPFQYSIDGNSFINDSVFNSLSIGKHYIKVRDAAGCEVDTIIEIKPNLFIPTGISPNGDGINDSWQILDLESYVNAEVRLFSLWGEKIFESLGNQKIFDGNNNGNPLPDGDYYFIIDLKNGTELLKGKLTVLR